MKSIKVLFGLLFTGSILFSCATKQEGTDPAPAASDNGITDSLIRTLQTEPAVASDEADVIKLNGKIQPNEAMQAKVYSLVSGKIKAVNVELGDFVRKGQTLASFPW